MNNKILDMNMETILDLMEDDDLKVTQIKKDEVYVVSKEEKYDLLTGEILENNKPVSNLPVSVQMNHTPPSSLAKDAGEDYGYVREKFRDLVNKGMHFLDSAINEAQASGNPKGAEAVSSLIKNLGEVTEKLYDVHIKTMDIESRNNPNQSGQVNVDNGVIFVGDSNDVMDYIEQKKQKVIDIDSTEVINTANNSQKT